MLYCIRLALCEEDDALIRAQFCQARARADARADEESHTHVYTYLCMKSILATAIGRMIGSLYMYIYICI